MITQAYIKQLFDYHNGDLYWKVSRSNCIKIGQRVGTKPTAKYAQLFLDKKSYKTHRVIFLYHHGYPPAEIDHINGDKTDNRIENLRSVTRQQNQFNTKLRKHTSSGLKNVTWYKQTNKWRVQIRVNKIKTHIGYFKDKELAELVAMESRDKLHKQFARHK